MVNLQERKKEKKLHSRIKTSCSKFIKGSAAIDIFIHIFAAFSINGSQRPSWTVHWHNFEKLNSKIILTETDQISGQCLYIGISAKLDPWFLCDPPPPPPYTKGQRVCSPPPPPSPPKLFGGPGPRAQDYNHSSS